MGTGRTEAATGEGAWVARMQEMPQNGIGVQGDWLPSTSMQVQQTQVMPTSPLEGYFAGALSTAKAFYRSSSRADVSHTVSNIPNDF